MIRFALLLCLRLPHDNLPFSRPLLMYVGEHTSRALIIDLQKPLRAYLHLVHDVVWDASLGKQNIELARHPASHRVYGELNL